MPLLGKLGRRAQVGGVGGVWKNLTDRTQCSTVLKSDQDALRSTELGLNARCLSYLTTCSLTADMSGFFLILMPTLSPLCAEGQDLKIPPSQGFISDFAGIIHRKTR